MRALDHVARRLAQWTRTSGDAALLLLDEAEDWAEGKAAVELLAAACRAIAFTPWWPGAARLHRRRRGCDDPPGVDSVADDRSRSATNRTQPMASMRLL
jgi:hypothetical protein